MWNRLIMSLSPEIMETPDHIEESEGDSFLLVNACSVDGPVTSSREEKDLVLALREKTSPSRRSFRLRTVKFLESLAEEMEQHPVKPPKIIPKKVDYIRRGKTGRVNECLMEDRFVLPSSEKENVPGFYNGKSFIVEVPMRSDNELPRSSKPPVRFSSYSRRLKLSTTVDDVSSVMKIVHQFSNDQESPKSPSRTALLLVEVQDLKVTPYQTPIVKKPDEENFPTELKRTADESKQWTNSVEKNIIQAGLPSPFRKVGETFPPFKKIHGHLRTHIRSHMPTDEHHKHQDLKIRSKGDETNTSEKCGRLKICDPAHDRRCHYHIRPTILREDEADDDESSICAASIISNEGSLISIMSEKSLFEKQEKSPKHSSIFIQCQNPASEKATFKPLARFSFSYGDNQFMDFSDVSYMNDCMYSVPYTSGLQNLELLSSRPTSLCFSKFDLVFSDEKSVFYKYHGKILRFSRKEGNMVIESEDNKHLEKDSDLTKNIWLKHFGNQLLGLLSGNVSNVGRMSGNNSASPQCSARRTRTEHFTGYPTEPGDEESSSANSVCSELAQFTPKLNTIPEMMLPEEADQTLYAIHVKSPLLQNEISMLSLSQYSLVSTQEYSYQTKEMMRSEVDQTSDAVPVKLPQALQNEIFNHPFSDYSLDSIHQLSNEPSTNQNFDENVYYKIGSARSSPLYGWNERIDSVSTMQKEEFLENLEDVPLWDEKKVGGSKIISKSFQSSLDLGKEASNGQVSLIEHIASTCGNDDQSFTETQQRKVTTPSHHLSIYEDIVSQQHLKRKAAFVTSYSLNETAHSTVIQKSKQHIQLETDELFPVIQKSRPHNKTKSSIINFFGGKEDIYWSDENDDNSEVFWEKNVHLMSGYSLQPCIPLRSISDQNIPRESSIFNRRQNSRNESNLEYAIKKSRRQYPGEKTTESKLHQTELDLL